MKKQYLCIWHGNCQDGHGAAWVVRKALGEENVEFFAAVHQNPPPDVTGRDVIMVDFCFKRDVMFDLAEKARSILVLDHHVSARDDLLGFGTKIGHDSRDIEFMRSFWAGTYDKVEGHPTTFQFFDMERSGAGLTWDFFNPGVPRPKLIDHIEDRDLWRFKLPFTREIQANLFSHEYDFELWGQFMESGENPKWLEQFKIQGLAIERKHHKDIAELVQVVTRPMKFRAPWLDGPAPADLGFVVVPAANLPYTMTSDAGHLLCERDFYGKPRRSSEIDGHFLGHPFAACFWLTPEGVVFSLRSREDGADVSAIAKLYQGGGHAHAAGFRVSMDRLAEFEP